MSQKDRKTSPGFIRILWSSIRLQRQNQADLAKIVKQIISDTAEISPAEIENSLQNAIDDGLLEVIHNAAGGLNRATKKNVDPRIFRVPNTEDIKVNLDDYDWYCFECHMPGSVQKCFDCTRAFHLACNTTNQEKEISLHSFYAPNHTDSSFNDSRDMFRMEVETDDSAVEAVSEAKPILQETSLDVKYLKNEIPNLKDETVDIKHSQFVDVVCVGEVRPPSRRRRNLSQNCKFEGVDNGASANDEERQRYCSSCRTLKRSELQNPPNMQIDEINYLLKFIYLRVKTWISNDTFSPLPFSTSVALTSKKDLTSFKNACFKRQTSLELLDQKIKQKEYKTLTEFHIDVMDIQHNLGILYGTNSAEYEATKYLVSDCSYELSEIRQCRDCYRHSNEKADKFWFCKPCVPRHELVFAKQAGYSYWPAKVIKVNHNQYDVRFFGAQHSRAIIDANFVQPLDTEIKHLKIKKSSSFNKAMEELRIHENLLQLPPGTFSYEAELQNPKPIQYITIATNVSANKTDLNQKIKEKVRKGRGRKGFPSERPVLQENNKPVAVALTIEVGSSQETLNGSTAQRKRSTNANISGRNLNDGGTTSANEGEDNVALDYSVGKKPKLTTPPGAKLQPVNKEKTIPQKKKLSRKQKLAVMDDTSEQCELETFDEDPHSSSQEALVSSTQEISIMPESKQNNTPRSKLKTNTSYSGVVATLANKLPTIKNQVAANRLALDTFQEEMDRWQSKVQQITEEHTRNISEVKKNQWCVLCEKKAIYHCCWNTTYCSTDCQQSHWDIEHKNACRRKQ